jgi:DNA-binding transcriptional MocR family regulator
MASKIQQLVDRFAADIRSGRMMLGTITPIASLPREGIALVTASRIYAELQARTGQRRDGARYIRAGHRRACRSRHRPAAGGLDMIDLNFNNPSLPEQTAMLRDGLRQLAASGDLSALLRYQPHGGRPHERAIMARHLGTRGLQVGGDEVLIVNGAQHGLAVCAMSLLKPGDVVAVDALTYPGFKVLAEALHLELLPLPVTATGPDLAALASSCLGRRVRAVYTMPTLHNPWAG